MFLPELPILIAEDNEDEALLLDRALKLIGVSSNVVILGTGEEVISYLKGHGEFGDRKRFPTPGVLVTDLKMNGIDGFELLEWLRNNPEFRVIPTMVFSNSSMPEDIRRAYELGANAYLVKPTTLEQLERMMRMTYEFWSLCAKTPLPSTLGYQPDYTGAC
jgi:CheY-like chemotaxis protein